MKNTKNRFNYTSYKIPVETKRLVIVTDIHNCHINWHDTACSERMELLCKTLQEEYAKNPYDAILALGDYSLDFWVYNEGGSYLWDPPVSYTKEFVKSYVSKMPTSFFMIPGNHEQYGQETWVDITGMPREYVITYGAYVFVMLDTYAGELDPKYNHDGCYTGINTELLSAVLEEHSDKKIILCVHELSIAQESEEARTLVQTSQNILCAFAGHTHRDNTVILPDSWKNLPVFYCGDFSYNSGRQREKNWGYRTLDLTKAILSTEYVKAKG